MGQVPAVFTEIANGIDNKLATHSIWRSITQVLREATMSIRNPGKLTARRAAKRQPTDDEITLSVPEAGKRYFGLSRNGSYAAAERGDIPTVQIGKLKRVPIRVLERRLEAAR